MLLYDKGLLIHRKWSPQRLPTANLIRSEAECSHDKGRLNVIRFVVLYIFICVYTIINKSSEAEPTPTSLPLSGKGDHEVVDE